MARFLLSIVLVSGLAWGVYTHQVVVGKGGVALIGRATPSFDEPVVDTRQWTPVTAVRNERVLRRLRRSDQLSILGSSVPARAMAAGMAIEDVAALTFGGHNPELVEQALEAGMRAGGIGGDVLGAAQRAGLDETGMETATQLLETSNHVMKRYQDLDARYDVNRRGAEAVNRALEVTNRGLGALNRVLGGGNHH